MKKAEILLPAARIVFFMLAAIVIWNMFAGAEWRFLSETARKIWAMAALGLYAIIQLELYRRRHENQ